MKLKRFVHLTIFWLVAIAVSALTFFRIYDDLPSLAEIIIGSLVYGFLALPFSFLHSVTFQGDIALQVFGGSFLLLITSYWIVLGLVQCLYIRQGGKVWMLISAGLILISSFRWLYYAMAMSGI